MIACFNSKANFLGYEQVGKRPTAVGRQTGTGQPEQFMAGQFGRFRFRIAAERGLLALMPLRRPHFLDEIGANVNESRRAAHRLGGRRNAAALPRRLRWGDVIGLLSGYV
jgi:hypothetical protein